MKLAGQFVAALVLVLSGVTVDVVTLPFFGRVEFDEAGRCSRCSGSSA